MSWLVVGVTLYPWVSFSWILDTHHHGQGPLFDVVRLGCRVFSGSSISHFNLQTNNRMAFISIPFNLLENLAGREIGRFSLFTILCVVYELTSWSYYPNVMIWSAGAGKDAGRHFRCLFGLRKRSQGHGDHWYVDSCVEVHPLWALCRLKIYVPDMQFCGERHLRLSESTLCNSHLETWSHCISSCCENISRVLPRIHLLLVVLESTPHLFFFLFFWK